MDFLKSLQLQRRRADSFLSADPLKGTTNPAEAEAFYNSLAGYYSSNGLYSDITLDSWSPAMQSLRTVCHRSVEFFVSKLMPGTLPEALPIVTDNEAIIEPVEDIWKWTNLNAKKPMAIRWLAIYGDLWIHPTSNENNTRVYMQFLKPQVITAWEEDDRGYVTYLRLDVPIDDGLTHTEEWTPDYFRIWEHRLGRTAEIDQLGVPVDEGYTMDLGIDFVPFVHVKFKDVGGSRGWGAFNHTLDKIDEANRMVTRLHQMLFRYNKPYMALSANSVDSSGAPLPPPSFDGESEESSEDAMIYSLPGNSTLTPMIPNIRYNEALAVLQDQIADIEKDMPELGYYRLRERGEMSGKAIRLLLSDAIDRVNEARDNFEQGMQRAENMCLTMGVYLGLFEAGIGSFDAGDFDHTYQMREIFPSSTEEKSDTLKTLTDAGIDIVTAGKLAGFKEEEIQPEKES